MDKNNYVVKANKFIEAKGRLKTLEQKLLAALISEIKAEDEDFQEYNLNIKDVGEFIGLTNNAVYERLSDISYNLLDKKLKLEEVNEKGKKVFIAVSLIASARHEEGSGIITITIAPDLKPYLLAIKGEETPFTQYMIKNILKLNGSYAIRLYEVLKQWENVRVKKFEIDNLKEMLGADEESYKRFDNFERRVLKPAKDEINEHTDIFITYEKIKTGRRISDIEFKIDSKDQEKKLYIEFLNGFYDIKEMQRKMGLEGVNLSSEQIIEIYNIAVEKTSHDNLDPFLYVSINYKYVKDKARHKYTYLKNAVNEDWGRAIIQIKTGYQVWD